MNSPTLEQIKAMPYDKFLAWQKKREREQREERGRKIAQKVLNKLFCVEERNKQYDY